MAAKKEKKPTVRVEVKGAANLALDKLEPFQGDLKTLERDEYEALRANINENGFSFTFHIWQNKGKNYIIDGHQRLFALKKMRDEGWGIPLMPVSLVEAKNFAAAKRKVLAGVSQYGKVTEKSLAEFLRTHDIPMDHVAATFRFPTIDVSGIVEAVGKFKIEPPLVATQAAVTEEMRHAGEGVKQVQLFFDADTHEIFMRKVGELSAHHKKTNVTDTLVEVVNEAHSRIKKK